MSFSNVRTLCFNVSFLHYYLFFSLRQFIVALKFTCGAISMHSAEAKIHYFMDFI